MHFNTRFKQQQQQYIANPTGNILDLLFVTNKQLVDTVKTDLPFGYPIIPSDHLSIKILTNVEIKNSFKTVHVLNYSKADWGSIEKTLGQINWELFFEDCASAEQMVLKFTAICNFLIKDFVPKSKIGKNRRQLEGQSWIKRIRSIEMR